jgi:hypothetical protein
MSHYIWVDARKAEGFEVKTVPPRASRVSSTRTI